MHDAACIQAGSSPGTKNSVPACACNKPQAEYAQPSGTSKHCIRKTACISAAVARFELRKNQEAPSVILPRPDGSVVDIKPAVMNGEGNIISNYDHWYVDSICANRLIDWYVDSICAHAYVVPCVSCTCCNHWAL